MFINNCYASNDENIIALQEEDTELATEVTPPPGGWTMLVPCVLILAVFYFLLLRPQEKRRKAHEELVKNVKPGEQVITASGILGAVSKIIDENIVEIEVAKEVFIKILKTSIVEISSRNKIKPKANKDKKSG